MATTSETTAIDFAQMTVLGHIARSHARLRPDAIALTFEGRATRFSEFDRNTNRVANAAANKAKGWLRTGDAGYLEQDKYLYIYDRVRDMIISRTENIDPAEVESAIYGHPAVAGVAVVGILDDKWGEAVKAFVVLQTRAAADAGAIIDLARSRIAHFKVPKSVDFIRALPRNASGKALFKDLREPFWAGRARRMN